MENYRKNDKHGNLPHHQVGQRELLRQATASDETALVEKQEHSGGRSPSKVQHLFLSSGIARFSQTRLRVHTNKPGHLPHLLHCTAGPISRRRHGYCQLHLLVSCRSHPTHARVQEVVVGRTKCESSGERRVSSSGRRSSQVVARSALLSEAVRGCGEHRSLLHFRHDLLLQPRIEEVGSRVNGQGSNAGPCCSSAVAGHNPVQWQRRKTQEQGPLICNHSVRCWSKSGLRGCDVGARSLLAHGLRCSDECVAGHIHHLES